VEEGIQGVMDAVVAAVVTAVLGLIGGYVIGNWRLKYEKLHERRAEVIAELSKRLAVMQDCAVRLTNEQQPRDVDRAAQIAQTEKAFFDLRDSYFANEAWLEHDTCLKVEAFLSAVHESLLAYVDTLNEKGYPMGEQGKQGREIGLRIKREVQPLRRELIDEFRAILYPPRGLGRREERNAERSDTTADQG
jgi:hypothetical protein